MVAFADSYKLAGLSPSAETIARREPVHKTLLETLTPLRTIELAKILFFGTDRVVPDWFVAAYSDADSGFTIVDNAREISVLAACLLRDTFPSSQLASLAVLCMCVGGLRLPAVDSEIVNVAYAANVSGALQQTSRAPGQVSKALVPKVRGSAQVEAVAAAVNDWPKMVEGLRATLAETDTLRTWANQIQSTMNAHAESLVAQREELSMLWWHIGGVSRTVDDAYAEMSKGSGAIISGWDLASLTSRIPGPPAAPALLQRTVQGIPGDGGELTIAEAVDQLPPIARASIARAPMERVPLEAFPILVAVRKAADVGPSPNWHMAFSRDTGLAPDSKLRPEAIATQVYREVLVLSALQNPT